MRDSELVFRLSSDETTYLIREDNTDLYMVGCTMLCGYFTIFISPIILDIIFGFGNLIQCKFYEKPFLNIFTWMAINGIFSLVSLFLYFMRAKLYVPYDFFWYKVIYVIDIVLNIFLLIWTALGVASFFMFYNINDNAYVLVRMIIAPIICMLKLVQIYYK